MKGYIYILAILTFFISCEDAIEVDTPSEPPRLIVDAVIRLDTTEQTTTARIKLSTSSSFFDENNFVSADLVQIQNLEYMSADNGPTQNFIRFVEVEPGLYEASANTQFFTKGRLELSIEYNNERFYSATEFVPSVPIDTLRQGDGTLFSGDEIEVIVSFTDNGATDDFYILDFDFNEYLVTEDEFYQGKQFVFSYFYDAELKSATELNIGILGADEGFYNYMNQVLVQSGTNQGPFQTPAATVRGNVLNVTGVDNLESIDPMKRSNNFALGYFAVVQEYKKSIVIYKDEN